MTENTNNQELLDAVAEATNDTDPDAATFDITDWLTPATQKDHRKTEEVTLIRDFSLEAEIYELNALEHELKKKTQPGVADPDASVADANPAADLERRKAELHERIKAASVTVTVRAMLQPEIKKLHGSLKQGDPQRDYRVLAEAVEFPGGAKIPASDWPAFHNTIGEGQYQQLIEAFNRVSFVAPVKVNATF